MTLTDDQKSKRGSSLDIPRADLQSLSDQVNRLVLHYFSNVSAFPVFPENYAGKTTSLIDTRLSTTSTPIETLLADCQTIFEHSRHNGHPRFFGYVASPATPIGAYADLIASALNSNVTCWRSGPAATEIERLTIRWLGSLIGYDEDAQGLLTSGGSMANLIAIHLASRRVTGSDVSRKGLWNSGAPLTLYASEEVHMSIPKAMDILGLGRDNVRLVACDDHLRMDVTQLATLIEQDLQKGYRPFCVVASAGTVGTGVVDPLAAIAEVAKRFNLWFHVDGAYGAPASLDTRKKKLFAGLELADSVSLDPHKWLYVPVDAGSLLFRDAQAVLAAFAVSGVDYIQTHGLSDAAAFAFWDYGVELSRRFRALKVWLTLRYYGREKISNAVADDLRLAEYMGMVIEKSLDFELLAPVELSICCFRYVPGQLREQLDQADGEQLDSIQRQLDQLNEKIMTSVQKSGQAYLSNATVRGRFALRACITNFRTTAADIDETLKVVRDAALRITG